MASDLDSSPSISFLELAASLLALVVVALLFKAFGLPALQFHE
jgi:hypothetical protein